MKECGVALPPHRLRGPDITITSTLCMSRTNHIAHHHIDVQLLSPVRAPPQHLLVTLAPAGLSIRWSGRSPTMGRQKRGVVRRPLWMPTPTIVVMVQSPVRFHPARTSHHWAVLRGLIPPSFYLLMFVLLWLVTLRLNIFLLCLLTLFLRGGIVGPGQEAAGAKLCDAVCLLCGAWHKTHQCDCHSLLRPAKIIGDPAGGDPLRLVPGGIVHTAHR